MSALLELRHVTKQFGGVTAVQDVSLALGQRETLGVMGPNGAGKTTLLNLIMGVYPLTAGKVLLRGEEITGLPPEERCHKGIGRTYQIPQPFHNMTVQQNVMVGCLYGRHRASMRQARDASMDILQRTGLISKANQPAKKLTLLELKRLELARALSLQPEVILLDEIGAGLIRSEIGELMGLIKELKASGLSIIIIEHVLEFIFQLCDRVMVLDWGKTVAEGTPKEMARDQRVTEIYLGSQASKLEGEQEGTNRSYRTYTPVAEPQPKRTPLLEVRDADVYYGAFQALFGLSAEVYEGEIVAMIGSNGAGKTTLVRTIGGMLRPARGDVLFNGKSLRGRQVHEIIEMGIAQCMEGRQIFPELTVLENLEIGAYTPRARAGAKERVDWIFELFPILKERQSQLGATLSGGQQQMLAIGRALMGDPKLLLLDEVSLGLAPVVIDELYGAIKTISEKGVTVVLVEQNVHRSLAIADRAYILERGHVTLSGTAAELAANENVVEHYFGLQMA